MSAALMRQAKLPLAGRSMELHAFKRAAPTTDAPAPLARAKLVFSAGASVPRYDWERGRAYLEQLVVDAGAIRMDRLKRGAPLLNNHNSYSLEGQIGVVENPTIRNGLGECEVTFSRRESVAGFVQDVSDGVIRNVSTGYIRHRIEMVPPAADGGDWVYRVTDWEPVEVSLVPIPADLDAQVRGAGAASVDGTDHLRTYPCDFIELPRDNAAAPTTSTRGFTMQQQAPTQQQQQTAANADEVRALVLRHGLPEAFGADLITRGLDESAANRAVLTELARRDGAAGGHVNVIPGNGLTGHRDYMQSTSASIEQRHIQMAEALAERMRGPRAAADNQYRNVDAPDMARECLELRGIATTGMSRAQVVERALHSTSDFPNLLNAAGQRSLRQAYTSYAGGIKRACRASTATNFRAKQRLMLGEAPALLQTNEHGEFKYGSTAETVESYSLKTFGRIFGLTRQAIINDDLDAFADMTMRMGRAAVEFENQALVDLLASNPVMSDTLAVFHATHANLGTGGPSALSETSLNTARTAMRLQKGVDGATPIDATPTWLIVPAALETAAQKLLAQLYPAQSANVNPFAGKLELIVDPRLDAKSATAWYLSADSNVIDTIEYSHLDTTNGGPEMFVQEGFKIDGVEMKVRLDFGSGVLDFRGLYKSNGV